MNRNLPSQQRKNRDPWFSFQDDFKDLINRFTDYDDFSKDVTTPSHFIPKIDIKDRGKDYLVMAEIPGMSEDDINISLNENVLTLEGEKKSEHKDEGKDFYRSEIAYGSFYRTIPLNDDVDDNKVEANYKDGVLKITLPKKEGVQSKSRKISISKNKQNLQGGQGSVKQ